MAGVDDEGQRVHRLGVDQDGNHGQVAFRVAVHLVVEAGIPARHRLQPVVEVDHHLVQGQAVDRHGAPPRVGQLHLNAAAPGAQCEHRAQVVVGD